MRVLILSWEYPPIVAGGLARHVRKLAEGLVREAGVDVHVLTRGSRTTPAYEVMEGVHVHRVPETTTPRDLDAFLAWLDRMNADMVAAGAELAAESDLVHGHDWLVAEAADALAREAGVPYLTTIHATEYGRHQGWVDKHPQSHIHGVETWMARRGGPAITRSHHNRGHRAHGYGPHQRPIDRIPHRIEPP